MKIFSITFILLFISVTLFAQGDVPRIIILGTGGTIAGEGQSSDRAGYKSGKIPIDDLIGEIPTIKKYADISGEQISSVGSQDMTIEIWQKLNERINQIFAKDEADGIVITHGTDTQEETAFFLNLTTRYKKPVVLTGSMRPATAISADGPKNLFDAIVVAAHPESKDRGVIVVFDENIYDGRDISKSNTTHLYGFEAFNGGPIGHIYDSRPVYYLTNDRSDQVSPFDIRKYKDLPRVEIVSMYADASGEIVNYWSEKGVDGIVISGVGNGNINLAMMKAIKKATDNGIKVVRASRVPSGRVVLEDEVDDRELGTIVSDDLSPQKARLLLMLGLTTTKDVPVLQSYFFKY